MGNSMVRENRRLNSVGGRDAFALSFSMLSCGGGERERILYILGMYFRTGELIFEFIISCPKLLCDLIFVTLIHLCVF